MDHVISHENQIKPFPTQLNPVLDSQDFDVCHKH